LRGESWQRIAFLRELVEEGPGPLEPLQGSWVWDRIIGGMHGDYRLIYFGEHQPTAWGFGLPKGVSYKADVIDTWDMTVETLPKTFANVKEIPLPGRPYVALRIRPIV
jgi:hypothetical protein